MDPIYIVLIIVLIVWMGIFIYLFYLHRKISRLSEFIQSLKDKNKPTDLTDRTREKG
jgi:CcmD family protein